jgi:hypothetical protein
MPIKDDIEHRGLPLEGSSISTYEHLAKVILTGQYYATILTGILNLAKSASTIMGIEPVQPMTNLLTPPTTPPSLASSSLSATPKSARSSQRDDDDDDDNKSRIGDEDEVKTEGGEDNNAAISHSSSSPAAASPPAVMSPVVNICKYTGPLPKHAKVKKIKKIFFLEIIFNFTWWWSGVYE